MEQILDSTKYDRVITKLEAPETQEMASKITIIGVFMAIFTAFVSGNINRKHGRRESQIQPFDWLQLILSTLRLGRLIAFDRVADPIRKPFTETVPDETGAGETVEARGSGVIYSIGQLISCPICAGTWVAAALVYGMQILPRPTKIFIAIMSTIGAAEFLNSITEAFSWTAQAARKFAGQKD
jgi:hypothetical protein